MRLSDAIKLGAMVRPQAVFDLFHNGRSCALGSAYEAGGVCGVAVDGLRWSVEAIRVMDDNARRVFPILLQPCPPCPNCGQVNGTSFGFTITHLNDDHRWTREAIADWVATIEPAQEINAVDPVAQHRERDPRAADLLLPSEVFVRAATG